MKYAVVVDSTTKLRKEFLKKIEDKVEVITIPVRVYIDDKEYEDSEEVSEKIIEALKEEKKVRNISSIDNQSRRNFRKIIKQIPVCLCSISFFAFEWNL